MAKTKRTRKPSWSSKLRNPYLLVLGILLVVIIGLTLFSGNHFFHKKKTETIVPSTNPSASKSQPTNAPSQAPTSSSNTTTPVQNPKSEPTTSTDTNAFLIEPSGTFVSYHQPSLSQAADVPSKESSSCHTTAGANCSISFTKEGITKTLATQKTDSNGYALWDWDVKDAGFTTGSWSISATATLGSQTKTVHDSLTLDIQP